MFLNKKLYILKMMYMCSLIQHELIVLDGFSHSHLIKVPS